MVKIWEKQAFVWFDVALGVFLYQLSNKWLIVSLIQLRGQKNVELLAPVWSGISGKRYLLNS